MKTNRFRETSYILQQFFDISLIVRILMVIALQVQWQENLFVPSKLVLEDQQKIGIVVTFRHWKGRRKTCLNSDD